MNIGLPPDQPFAGETGGVLGTQQILTLLESGWLMEVGTWNEARLRPAAYDLAIAADDLRIPNPADPERPLYFPEGQPKPDGGFELLPGEFAFVTTNERLCLPWTVAANLGVKNRFARKGLLILTGLVVDPGFGLLAHKEGWRKSPQRLHFGIANVGRERVTITTGQEAFASVQFVKVDGDVLLEEVHSPRKADPVAKGFVLFTELERDVEDLKVDVVETKASVQNIVLFGLFVIAATFLGALVALFLGAVSNEALSARLSRAITIVENRPWAAFILAVILGGLALSLTAVVFWPIARMISTRSRRRLRLRS